MRTSLPLASTLTKFVGCLLRSKGIRLTEPARWADELRFVAVLTAAMTLSLAADVSRASVILFEDFETPVIDVEGATTPVLPAGWQSNGIDEPRIWRPGSIAVAPTLFIPRWNQAEPMASPAGGNQILFLNAWEGIYKQAGPIEPNTIYTLSAATGYDLAFPNSFAFPLDWSLQLYADLNDDGQLTPSDAFLAQEFGGSGNEVTPLPGDWVTNSTSFDSAQIDPSLLGKTLLVLLFNTRNNDFSVSNYDNVMLTAVPVPELSTIPLVLASALVLGLWKLARRRMA